MTTLTNDWTVVVVAVNDLDVVVHTIVVTFHLKSTFNIQTCPLWMKSEDSVYVDTDTSLLVLAF